MTDLGHKNCAFARIFFSLLLLAAREALSSTLLQRSSLAPIETALTD